MARLRARALAVVAGVPAAFALAAGLLTIATPGTPAEAATSAGPTQQVSAAPWFVRRDLVRPAHPPLDVTYRSRTDDPVVFITIDDGVHKSRPALALVQRWKLPVTAFLSTWTVKDRAPYFRAITQWGSIQNHTATHASLARSTTKLEHELCASQRQLAADFGTQPWLLRPPYGAGADRMEVQVTAERCGIARIVMWDAVVDKGKLSVPGGKLRNGDIVLLHFTPNLAKDLRVAVKAAHKAGLRPANLADYIPDTNGKAA